jgi:tetratricopeptide (TPR) repeat protein
MESNMEELLLSRAAAEEDLLSLTIDNGLKELLRDHEPRKLYLPPASEEVDTSGEESPLPSGGKNFADLSRKLPRISARQDMMVFTKRNKKKAKKIFEKLSEGKFAYTWAQNETSLVVRVLEDDELQELLGDTSQRLDNNNTTTQPYFLDVSLLTGGDWSSLQSDESPLFRELFHHGQRRTLVRRVFHRFYRQHAAKDLLSVHRVKIYHQLRRHFDEAKLYAHLIDICIAFADASFTNDCDDMADHLVKVGEALETKGRFRDAAGVYKDVARGLANRTLSGAGNKSQHIAQVTAFAGLAYKRAGDLNDAEKYYVRALWQDINFPQSAAWDVNHTTTNTLLFNIMTLMSASLPSDGDKNVSALGQCWAPFVGLLYAAGFTTTMDPFFCQKAAIYQQRLKTQVTASKKTALRALRALVPPSNQTLPDVTKFRSKLMAYVQASQRRTLCVPICRELLSAKEIKKRDKGACRAIVSDVIQMDGRCVDFDSCCNDACCHIPRSSAHLFYCPCRDVRYCCKECQVSHWASHKLTCTTRKKKYKAQK